MINTPRSVRSWAPNPQESALKADPTKKTPAGAANPLGDQNVGEVLNKIVDPNWVDPKKVGREHKKDLDKDAFFKLMLTQMKNQDPTNPMQSHDMAAQLAQFTSLEQLFNINEGIGALKKGQEPMSDYQVLNFMGKSISADSSKLARVKGDKSHELRFNLRGDAVSAEITIKDAEGNTVRKLPLQALKKGANTATWNGYTEDDQMARAGDYYFTIEAKNQAGSSISAETSVKGRITGVNYTSKGPILLIGDQTVYLQDVKKIEDVDLKESEKAQQGAPAQAAPAPTGGGLAKNEEGAPPETFGRGNLASVSMSSAVKNQVDKAAGN
ncbi:MAG: flagellar hook capping FlgD N-terminal domain-containing protein [Bdellovibrionia bacterium]